MLSVLGHFITAMNVLAAIVFIECAFYCLGISALICIIYNLGKLHRELKKQTDQGTLGNPINLRVDHYLVEPLTRHTVTETYDNLGEEELDDYK